MATVARLKAHSFTRRMLDRVLDFIELSHFSALVFDGQLASSAPRSALLLLRPPSLLVGSPSDSTRVVPFFFLSPLILQLIFIQIQIFNLFRFKTRRNRGTALACSIAPDREPGRMIMIAVARAAPMARIFDSKASVAVNVVFS